MEWIQYFKYQTPLTWYNWSNNVSFYTPQLDFSTPLPCNKYDLDVIKKPVSPCKMSQDYVEFSLLTLISNRDFSWINPFSRNAVQT